METIDKVLKSSQIPSESDKNALETSTKSTKDLNNRAKLAANYIWPVMADMYSIFKVKYGDTPSPTWIACLKDLNELEIKKGLAACVEKYPEYPPGASLFRALCQGRDLDAEGNDSSWAHKSEAYVDFNDPAHPSYEPKRIESDEAKEIKRKNAKSQIAKLKNILK